MPYCMLLIGSSEDTWGNLHLIIKGDRIIFNGESFCRIFINNHKNLLISLLDLIGGSMTVLPNWPLGVTWQTYNTGRRDIKKRCGPIWRFLVIFARANFGHLISKVKQILTNLELSSSLPIKEAKLPLLKDFLRLSR